MLAYLILFSRFYWHRVFNILHQSKWKEEYCLVYISLRITCLLFHVLHKLWERLRNRRYKLSITIWLY